MTPAHLPLLWADKEKAYNGPVANILKVPEAQFKAVMRVLLNTPPMPMADIPRRREPKRPKSKRPTAKQGKS